jgi:hypothetical protein
MSQPRNDVNASVPKFCLTLEEHRRTAEGRVRTPQEFVEHFFLNDEKGVTDRVFRHLPKEVRGPMLVAWGLRAQKSALRDSDEKVRDVVHDALIAGDLDAAAFEEGITPETLVRWLPLGDWWAFWRGGKLGKEALTKALDTGFALAFFDPKLFLDTLEGRGGKARGTDVIGEGLTKTEMLDWVRKIYLGGDCSAKGVLAALGWDLALQKTSNDALIAFLDSIAAKIGLTGGESAGQHLTSRPSEVPQSTGVAKAKRPSLNLVPDAEDVTFDVVDEQAGTTGEAGTSPR